MFNPFRSSVRARVLSSRIGSLIMLFQRSPVIQMIFPEAKMLGGAGLGEIAKWTVATVAGLGAYDSVAGATTIAQLAPNAGSTTVPATKGQALSFVFQLTNYSDTPGSWKVTGLPTGLTHTDAKNNSIDSVSGTPTQTGSFSVKITAYSKTTYSGDSFSRTFTMNVAADPAAAITTNPASVTINSGQTSTLTVTASGTAPLTYQWYRGASGNTSSPVGTNSASFTTPALTATTSYWVKVSNSANPGGSNSSTATVTVNQPAAITSHPASVTINSGGTTTLSASASGTAPLTYQWYRGAKGVTTAPVGTNSSSFTTPALTATTSYWVKVTNVANAAGAQSNAATVTVNRSSLPLSRQPLSLSTVKQRA
jgi:outer membrane protein W